jgi:hypothetical protein
MTGIFSVPHPGAKAPNAITRYWLGEALTWVLRVRLLAEMGVSLGDVSATAAQKPVFQEVLQELRDLCATEEKLPGQRGRRH